FFIVRLLLFVRLRVTKVGQNSAGQFCSRQWEICNSKATPIGLLAGGSRVDLDGDRHARRLSHGLTAQHST
ncbi:MAG: hypothetical protein WBC84_08930, partial [Pseudolabrys sp.]